jgi:host factor-I protein
VLGLTAITRQELPVNFSVSRSASQSAVPRSRILQRAGGRTQVMKDGIEATATLQASEKKDEGFVSRKLIRPSLGTAARSEKLERSDRVPSNVNKRIAPPEQTHAENFYYQKQMQSKTPVVVVLNDGEEIHGLIEWYDKNCIKLVREGGFNLLIYKPAIRYMYKAGEVPKP